MVIGPREHFGRTSFMPHNLPMTLMGTGLLWFGWFGFNAGSALAANGVAATAFTSTHLGGMSGMAMWSIMEWLHTGRPTTLGAASGAIAGLVAITPAAGFVSPVAAIVIGLVAGAICYLAVRQKSKLGYDDALDVVGVHFVGGVVGVLLIGFLATAVMTGGPQGLFYGGGLVQLGKQALAMVVVAAYAFIVSFALAKLIDRTIGFRLSPEDETAGVDFTQHAESAYAEGVHGHQPLRRPLFGEQRPRPDTADED
jgi:Amt family ammonium transporter